MNYGDHRLFLYDNIVDLVLTTTSLYVDNRPMNNKRLQAHKGLTNTIMFNIRNRDRKLQNVFSDVLVAYIVNPATRSRLLVKTLEDTSDVGIVKLELTEGDLQNITSGLYRMYIARTTQDGVNSPVYSTQNNDVAFDIEVSDETMFDPVATQYDANHTQVNSTPDVYATSAFSGNLAKNYTNPYHTVALYTDTYTGNITIQGSCISTAPDSDNESTDWFTLETIPLSNVSSITSRTYSAPLNWVRVIHTPDNNTSILSNVLVRN